MNAGAARLIIVEKFNEIESLPAREDNPEVLAVAGTLRGLLAGVDVTVGILDVP